MCYAIELLVVVSSHSALDVNIAVMSRLGVRVLAQGFILNCAC